ncbi:hypothetical protein FNU76_03320 [Chitinimonas arctica]|uniref:peptidylprolyl isomerase n=1 Tax=Chitinimonas arctica TaxID=2594795 RepID=A0A516SBE1_9NEIS|nr:peptidylprolyl isomerase [Chitinimonas arctica]QDQ25464.1 hypothetical protein FNU76_03320 [Chitinimonas arctica]
MRRPAYQRLALWASLTVSLTVGAASRDSVNDPSLVARINGEPVTLAGLSVLQRIGGHQEGAAPLNKVLASLIDNRLLGDYASRRFDEAALFPAVGVAFARDVAVEDQLIANLRRVYKAELEAALAKVGGLDKLVLQRHSPTPQTLETVFPRTDTVRLDGELSAAQLGQAGRIPLLDYRLPHGEQGRITLGDIWHRQNIQGKTQLAGGDAGFREQQAMQLLAGKFVLAWTRRDSGLAIADLDLLRRAIEDRDRRGALLRLLGVEADMHYSSDHLARLAAAITSAEVQDYYVAHPAEFKRIEKVRARHIRCADAGRCQSAYEKLQHGGDFSEVAKAFSDAEDAGQGGELGWLLPNAGQAPWLNELAFALPPGKPSRPVREPARDGVASWRIVLVEERREGMQPADSEAVRYIASQALAKRKAVAYFKDLRESLYREADVELNPDALGFRQAALPGKE